MEGTAIFTVCSFIILIASTITAIITIVNSVKNPAKKYKERQDTELKNLIIDTIKEVLPGLLKEHDKEIRERYKSDREKYLNDIKASVLSDTQNELNQVKILGLQYEALVISAKDVLREKIIKIYLANKDDKRISMIDSEKLNQFYKDYKALNGNSYIDKYYNRMKKWEVIDDDDADDDEIL